MHIYDTLVVNGDFTTSGGGTVNIDGPGILIVRGNLTSTGGSRIITSGRVAVTGTVLTTGGGNITNNATGTNGFYNFQTATNDWATMNSETFHDDQQMIVRDNPFYNFAVYGTTVLPVQILYFKAQSKSSSIHLSWATSSEKNFDYFNVERSTDLKQWTNIGEVAGAGNSNDIVKYEYEDHSPANGKMYYRLKATDFDGSVEFHEVISISYLHNQLATMYPNPLNGGSLFFDIESGPGEISIINTTGSEIFHMALREGKNEVEFARTLKSGFYIVLLKQENSEEKLKLKIN